MRTTKNQLSLHKTPQRKATLFKLPLLTQTTRLALSGKKLSLALCFSGLALLTGCSDRVALADDEMAAIRASESIPIEPIPEPELVDDYVYDAADIRSPFMPPSLLYQQQAASDNNGVAPDLNREKEVLESYELSQLVYRGMVVSPEGIQHGLIQRPDGVVESVEVGDYMGMNDGRIVEITPTQINLVEIIPDNRAGYVEKPASVVSPI